MPSVYGETLLLAVFFVEGILCWFQHLENPNTQGPSLLSTCKLCYPFTGEAQIGVYRDSDKNDIARTGRYELRSAVWPKILWELQGATPAPHCSRSNPPMRKDSRDLGVPFSFEGIWGGF